MSIARKTAAIVAVASLALSGALCLSGCQDGQEQDSAGSGTNSFLGLINQDPRNGEEPLPEYMLGGQSSDKPELTDEEIAAGMDSAFAGVPARDFVGASNQEIIDALIKSGCVQNIAFDGSGYWVSPDKSTVYSIKAIDSKAPLSPSKASQADNEDTFLSVSTTYPLADGWTLESIIRQVSGADSVSNFREENVDGKVSSVGVAVLGEEDGGNVEKVLVTASRPDGNKADVVLELYLGGMQSDVESVADKYPLGK